MNNPVLEGVIMTLIYGVKSVSRKSEHALFLLANYITAQFPDVAKLIIMFRGRSFMTSATF